MKHSHPSNHNGGPELTDDYIDVRHALMVAIRDCAEARGDPAFIGLVICTYMDRSGGIAHPSVRRIAEITGISVNRIASLAEQLQSYGLLIVHRSKGRGGIKYECAINYEQAIAIYCRGKRNAAEVAREKKPMSPLESDIKPAMSPSESDNKHVMSPPESDNKINVTGSGDLMSPEGRLMSPETAPRRIEWVDQVFLGGRFSA